MLCATTKTYLKLTYYTENDRMDKKEQEEEVVREARKTLYSMTAGKTLVDRTK